MENVRIKKADVTIKQLIIIVLSICKKLKKNLPSHKVASVLQSLNIIAVQQEYDPIINLGCNGSMLRGVLNNDGADVNVMIIPTMRYIGIEIERPLLITLKMGKKCYCKP